MIKTLARISGYAAKAFYTLLIGNGGVITRRELLDAGFKTNRIDEIVLSLQVDGHIIKVTGGVYRVKDYPHPQGNPVNVVNNMLTNKQTN